MSVSLSSELFAVKSEARRRKNLGAWRDPPDAVDAGASKACQIGDSAKLPQMAAGRPHYERPSRRSTCSFYHNTTAEPPIAVAAACVKKEREQITHQ